MPVTLTSRIPEIIAELPVRGKEASLGIAEEIATAAAAGAPVESGELRDSIEAESVTGGAGVMAAWYYHFTEFGTTNQAAQPYLIPAVEATRVAINAEARRFLAGL